MSETSTSPVTCEICGNVMQKKNFKIRLEDKETALHINPQAIQTIVIPAKIN